MVQSDSRPAATTAICEFTGPRFDADSESLSEWLGALRAAGVRQAGPALILALESLRRADCSPSRRFAVLRLLKTPVLKTCAGLPKPWGAAIDAVRRGVTVEQRLYRLMFQNLNQTLHQLDRCYVAQDERQARRRGWAVRNLFRFFGRQVRYGALWGRSLPENSWRDLHDLYVYLMVRRVAPRAGLDSDDPVLGAETEYKELLLFGLAAQLTGVGVRSGPVLDGLKQWAQRTVLNDPQGMCGERGLYVVEVAEDRPPRCHLGPLGTDFRGWVLQPPRQFFDQLASCAGEQDRAPRPIALGWQPLAVAC